MGLPPYTPDGSLPLIPPEGCIAKDLMERYGVSKQTLYTRIKAVGVTGSKKGKVVIFSSADVYQLDACHQRLGQNYTLKDIQDARDDFYTDSEPFVDITADSSVSPNHEQTELSIPKHRADVFALTQAIKDAIVATTPPPPTDPLAPYRMLRESCNEKYQLTSQSLREILGLSQSTINSWDKEVQRNGFLLRRVGPGKWRVFELDEQEEMDLAA